MNIDGWAGAVKSIMPGLKEMSFAVAQLILL
jgi:hypothetical protein